MSVNPLAVAVSVIPTCGEAGEIVTVPAVGAEFRTVTVALAVMLFILCESLA